MQKINLESGVDWADLRFNPVQGLCPNMDCSIYDLCYMKRPPFCFSVNKNPNLRLDEKKLMVKLPDEPKRIFVQDNLELFHKKTIQWVQPIIDRTKIYPQHTFMFLTKKPKGYARFDFPKNCWLGVTVTGPQDLWRIEPLVTLLPKSIGAALHGEKKRINMNLCFVSIEPFLLPLEENLGDYGFQCLDWVIVGALTGPKSRGRQPRAEWIEQIMKFYNDRWDKQGQNRPALFLKNNLAPVWGGKLIQEFPKQ